MNRLTLALDVMGGDFGPRITIPASLQALEQDPMLHLLLFGDSQAISSYLANIPHHLRQRINLQHCDRVVKNQQGLSHALRHSKGSSMRLAIESVRDGAAQGCVSGGDTAVLMGLSKVLLQPLAGIQRPALVSNIPTIDGKQSVMLDLGANIDCSAETLVQFAQMGAIFAENSFGLVYPRVALLNIGIEELKGLKNIRDASQLLQQQTNLHYIGYIEGNYLLNGYADVIVCDGFAGNIALKTLEGTAKNIFSLLKGNKKQPPSLIKKLLIRIGKYTLRKYFVQLKQFNPDQYNGASLLGLTSVVVKSHGSANQAAFLYAIQQAAWQVRSEIPNKILTGLEKN
ncbi:phosphate acyltransferase PlsX [Pasteurellaceae bacterium USgator11]|nr:phosphate acyltransferase PlsX [Pasteurellaceae bacterium UScroc12]TNG96696.1 phosphate acyltransferase PlsX [Pasteurellaceae bacterium USgator41]TNG98174.1 phosphate acyltransferase PlsX [Pasteurellaceae bacterium USgator11]TNG99759.1 phosphate acyltransferase PlsX [Pasteurellaceae bacterium UScroc31]